MLLSFQIGTRLFRMVGHVPVCQRLWEIFEKESFTPLLDLTTMLSNENWL